jgi:hypothetical protein
MECTNPNGERCFNFGVNEHGQAECYWPNCACAKAEPRATEGKEWPCPKCGEYSVADHEQCPGCGRFGRASDVAAPPSPPVETYVDRARIGGDVTTECDIRQNADGSITVEDVRYLDRPADDARDAALTYEIANGQLVVRIGVDTLAHALQTGDEWCAEFRITDSHVFASAVVAELENHEDERGETPITRALTEAAGRAIESAADGVEEVAAMTADQAKHSKASAPSPEPRATEGKDDAGEICGTCKGSGTIIEVQDGVPGGEWCRECDGIGRIAADPAPAPLTAPRNLTSLQRAILQNMVEDDDVPQPERIAIAAAISICDYAKTAGGGK